MIEAESESRPLNDKIAVLVSGGLDSAILVAEQLQASQTVFPLYIRGRLYWESAELEHLHRFLAAIARPALRPLQILELPVDDLLASHWSFTGQGTPRATDPDEMVFVPARNVLLLTKALVWCHLAGVPRLALGTLGSNPFPDATSAFFNDYQTLVNRAIGSAVEIVRPYENIHKPELLRRSRHLPLERTFSCLRPLEGMHCGRCNKCEERRRAFAEANLEDPTPYPRS